MKKLLLLFGLGLASVCGFSVHAANITPGQGYKLRLVSHASHANRPTDGSDVYFNMESTANGSACFSTTASIIYFDKVASDGRFVIRTGSESTNGIRTYGVTSNGWTPITNNTAKTFWYILDGTESPKEAGNSVVYFARTHTATSDTYSNYAGLDAGNATIWNDKANKCEWELIPVGDPAPIAITSGKPYFVKKKDSELYLNLLTYGTVGGNATENKNASLQSEPTPIYFTKVGDYGFTLRSDKETGNYLTANSWNAVLNTTAFTWGVVDYGTDEDGNVVFGLANTNASQPGYANADASQGAGVKVYSNNDPSKWILIPIAATPKSVSVKFVDENGNIVEQRTVSMLDGTTYTLTPSAAFYVGSREYTFHEDNIETVEVEVSLLLPFQYTATTDNMIWQAVRQHRGYKTALLNNLKTRFTWTYTADENHNIVDWCPTDAFAECFEDTQLWAFVGSYPEGFKIYNKAAGTGKCLYKTSDNFTVVGDSDTNNVWKVYPNKDGAAQDTYCCFSIDGTSYINLNVNVNSAQTLTYWSDADNGSSCWFLAPADPLIAYSEDMHEVKVENHPGIVGTCSGECNVASAREAAEADRYNLEKAATLSEAIVEHENHTVHLIPDAWYRLRSAANGGYIVSGNDETFGILGGNQAPRTNHYTLVKFEATETEGVYNLLSQGCYFGKLGALEEHLQMTTDNIGNYSVEAATIAYNNEDLTAKYLIRDVDQELAHTDSQYGLMNCIHHWAGGQNHIIPQVENWLPSKWYIEPANELDVTLTDLKFSDMYLGFGYFPFPVSAPEGVTLHYVYPGTDRNNNHVVSYTKNGVPTVPAETAFLIMSPSKDVTLAIDDAAASQMLKVAGDKDSNTLVGSYRPTSAQAGDFVFKANEDGEPVFAKASEATTIGSNSAYIPATSLPEGIRNVEAFSFNDPDGTTGIIEIEGEITVNEAIYDLQGRRLAAPVKGINIIGGRKVLVK